VRRETVWCWNSDDEILLLTMTATDVWTANIGLQLLVHNTNDTDC